MLGVTGLRNYSFWYAFSSAGCIIMFWAFISLIQISKTIIGFNAGRKSSRHKMLIRYLQLMMFTQVRVRADQSSLSHDPVLLLSDNNFNVRCWYLAIVFY
jgi:hypothetical protein